MKLPNLDKATVPPEKIKSYLLNLEHEEGGGKAKFFIHVGFSQTQWENLAQALIYHAHLHEVVKEEKTIFGIRYIIEGSIKTPNEREVKLRVVWFIPKDKVIPQLVTAYPLEQSE